MQICLLNCRSPFLIDEKVFPPLGLLAVGTALKLQGHDVRINDEPDKSDYFGIGPTTAQYPYALQMLQRIKALGKQVVIGGHHAVTNTAECLADGFDTVAIGDGENATEELFKTSGIVDLGKKPLDEYPLVDRSLVDIQSYCYKINNKSATTMLTTRGCPYHCGFCSKTENKVRYRSTELIAKEIDYLHKSWGYDALMFFDDTFILNKRRALRICEIMASRSITWRCFVRGDLVLQHGDELIKAMANSGCVEVGIGIESGSQRILKTINKGESISVIQEAIELLTQNNIRVKGFFIIGLPGEDHKSLEETKRFVESVHLDDVDFTVYQPYVGSPIWEDKSRYDIEWDVLENQQRFYKGRANEYQCQVRTSALSADEIVAYRDYLECLFQNRKHAT